jgi:hypothetical protein
MDMLFKDATVSDVHSPGALGPDGRRKRRILRTLRIDEISAVDFPAQAHARALIIKRHAPEPELADDDLSLGAAIAEISKRLSPDEAADLFERVGRTRGERDRQPGETIEKCRARFWGSAEGRELRELAKLQFAKPDPRNKAPGHGQHAPTNTPAKPREEDKAPTTGLGARPKDGEAKKALASRAAELMASDKRLTREKAVARIAESRSSSDQALWRNARAEARS